MNMITSKKREVTNEEVTDFLVLDDSLTKYLFEKECFKNKEYVKAIQRFDLCAHPEDLAKCGKDLQDLRASLAREFLGRLPQ